MRGWHNRTGEKHERSASSSAVRAASVLHRSPIEIPNPNPRVVPLAPCGGAAVPACPRRRTRAPRRSEVAHQPSRPRDGMEGAAATGHKRAPPAVENEDNGCSGGGRGRGATPGRRGPSSAPANLSSPGTTNLSSSTGSKNAKKKYKTIDLKSFFKSSLSNGSGPSTRESGIIVSEEGEVQGQSMGLGDAEQQEDQVSVEFEDAHTPLPPQDAEGKGKHQSTTLVRPGDTRWGSHCTTLLRIESMWDSVVKVLSMVHEDERNPGRAAGLVRKMECFSFVFNMKFMLKVLRITNELSLLLQRKDQNIVEAMSLLVDVKTRLMNFRNEGWQPLFEEVKSFCEAKKIPIPNMDKKVPRWGRSRLDGNLITLEHHYRVDTFFVALDSIITEMDHRFNEVSSELLVCFSCLDPRDSFSRFDIDKLARLTEIYNKDFSDDDRSYIRDQLELFLIHVRRVDHFVGCHDLGSLAMKVVETRRHTVFPLVYRLIELALLLPVATASVERAFSAMKIIKTDLRNKMSDEWLNDLALCYIEKEIFRGIDCDKVKKRFQVMKKRRMELPKPPRARGPSNA